MKAFLRSLEVLSDLSDQEIELLARTCREVRFRADERILRQGERADAAYILKEGQAEAMIEKPGAEPLRLSAILPGELFGEMALFDDSPRSASVAATTDCTVVEIRRGAFLQEIAHNPAAAMKLLAVIARRLRRAERVVSDFSDRIYGDVLPRLQEAAAAQLESAKTICEESKRRAEATIEQARHLQTTTDHHWTNLVRMGSVVGILLLGGGALATFFGFDKIDSVAERTVNRMSSSWTTQFSESLSEVEQLKSATETLKADAEDYVRGIKQRIGKDLEDLDVMRQTALEFDKMRRDMQLVGPDRAIGRSDVSGDVARDFVAAQRNLMAQYFRQPSRWESQILIEALDLLTEALDRRYLAVHDDDWELVTETVVQALKGPPNHWRQRLKLNEVTVKLYGHMVDARYQRGARAMIHRLEALLGSGTQTPAAASLTATILARLGSDSPLVKTQLRAQQQSESPWRRSQASIDLIALGQGDAWAPLLEDIAGQFVQAKPGENGQARQTRREAAFAAAHLIAAAAVERGLPARRYFDSAALDAQLVADRLGVAAESWPPDTPEGAPLIDFTILDGLTSEPSRWNRLYWRYSCDLLCELGCRSPGATSAGEWCTQCLDALQTQYFRHGTGVDRSAESCAGQ